MREVNPYAIAKEHVFPWIPILGTANQLEEGIYKLERGDKTGYVDLILAGGSFVGDVTLVTGLLRRTVAAPAEFAARGTRGEVLGVARNYRQAQPGFDLEIINGGNRGARFLEMPPSLPGELELPRGAYAPPGRVAPSTARLIGVTDKEAASLSNALRRIEIDGQRAIKSVEAFGSRAGGTYRGRPPLLTSDLDIYVTVNSKVANSPARLQQVRIQVNEISDLFGRVKKLPVNPVVEIDAVATAHKLQFKQTPFVPLE